MRRFLILQVILVSIISCGQNDKKQEEAGSTPVDTISKHKETALLSKDTIVDAGSIPQKAGEEKEISITPIARNSKDVPPFKTSGIYLHAKKNIDGSYLFLGPANEWGVININGKIEKLKFVKGYEDEATYANANYQMTYSLSYLNAPPGENPTVEGTIVIRGKGYKTYRGQLWGEWGVD